MEFRILGSLDVVDGGRPLPISGRRQQALLALLLLHANEVVASDRVIEELWGEEPPKSGAAAVQTQMSRLRRALGPAGGELLETRPPGYVLHVASDALDAARFERLLEQGKESLAAGDPAAAAQTLSDALDLWRGPALADFPYERFAQQAIARLEDLRAGCQEARLEADLALGRHADVVGELEALVAAHPLDERLRGLLMIALYRSGRQADALEAYRQTSISACTAVWPGNDNLQVLTRLVDGRCILLAPRPQDDPPRETSIRELYRQGFVLHPPPPIPRSGRVARTPHLEWR